MAGERFDLVTGGAGFIGSALTAALVAAGRRVIVLDDLSTGRRQNLTGLASDRLELAVGDICDRALVEALARRAERIFHLACVGLRRSIADPAAAHRVNAEGTLAVLLAARDVGIERFVHVSSSEVYGPARHVPMAEEHPLEPTTPYGASKLAGEAYARSFHRTYGLPVAILRPFNAYGLNCHHEGDSGEVIPRFVVRALAGAPLIVFGDGAQTRDFTAVSDTVAGILAAASAPAMIGETVNLGTGRETGIAELARMVSRLAADGAARIEHDAPRPGDVQRLSADSAKARRLLGWAPRIALADGLAGLIAWYRSLGASPQALLAEEVVHNWLPTPPETVARRRA